MHQPSNPVSNRQLRVAELLRHALVEILNKGKVLDAELIDMPITVSYVTVNADLRYATIYVMPFGHIGQSIEADKVLFIAKLNKLSHKFRHLISQTVKLRYTPEIKFQFDESFDADVFTAK
jgi:ribosome-binding factor A